MSLRTKVLLVLAFTVVAYAAADHALQRTAVFDAYVALEEGEAHKDVQRVVESIHTELEHLDRTCRKWAEWDDTVAFVAEQDEAFLSSNFGDSTFLDNPGLTLAYLCDLEGRVLFARSLHPETREPLRFKRLPTGALAVNHPLLRLDGPHSRVKGVYMTEHGPLLVSSRPILSSAGDGPVHGTLFVGKLFTESLVTDLATQMSVEFDIKLESDLQDLSRDEQRIRDELTVSAWAASSRDQLPADAEVPPSSFSGSAEDDREIYRLAYNQTRIITQVRDDDVLLAYTTFPDIEKRPELFIRAEIPRHITQQGRATIRYAAISTVAASMLLMLVLTVLLRKIVLNPIRRLTDHAVHIGRTEDFDAKLELQRDDEVGILSREFDDMMTKLQQSRAALAQAARAAGMSEIATGVLHNVGNALNSVNVSATLAANKARNSCATDLQKVLTIVSDTAGDLATFLENDPRGKHFYPMLMQLSKQLVDEKDSLSREIGDMNEGLEHIKELVRSQQSFAGRSGVFERASLATVVAQARGITDSSGSSRSDIRIEIDCDAVPPFDMDKNRVMEILVNLIQNARQSVAESGNPDGCVSIRGEVRGDRVLLSVQDNGIGIARENLASVFNHGFTTKPDGHGFGLHTSANAATEMKGKLVAHSEGPGTGATFTLDVPATGLATQGKAA